MYIFITAIDVYVSWPPFDAGAVRCLKGIVVYDIMPV